ncbi:MAG: hypothetical protein H6734_17430 [Alphaproteobacteria bacterium]|nr:hypothetical protein [Alphaproteobacteria bacterium]
MAYPPALKKELEKYWTKVLKKGGHFGVALNGYPADKSATPVLLVHPTKEVDKARIKRLDSEGRVNTQKIIFGRVEVGTEPTFWISEESPVKSPMMFRKALKRLAEHDDLGGLTPKLTKLKKVPVALEGETSVEDEVVDTSDARQKGGKSKLKKMLGIGIYAQLLKKLDKWNSRFAQGVKTSQIDKARSSLTEIRDEAQKWLNENRDGKNDRRAEVNAILTKVARAEDKLNALAGALRETREVDGLLESDRELTLDEQERVKRNLQARLLGTQDEDERATILETLRNLPGKVQEDHTAARRAFDELEPGERGEAAKELGDAQQRALKLLETFRTAGGGARDVTNVTGEGRLTAEQVPEKLRTLVDDMLSVAPELEGPVQDQQMKALDGLLQSLDDQQDELYGPVLEKLRTFAVDQTLSSFLEVLETHEVEEALGALGRGNDSTTKARSIVARELARDEADLLASSAKELLGDLLEVAPPEYDENNKKVYPPEVLERFETAIDTLLEQLFSDPAAALGPRLLALAGELYARVATTCDPRMAVFTLNDLVFLRWVNPTITVQLKQGDRVPQGAVTMAMVLQCVFNATKPNLSQFEPIAARWAKRVPGYWLRLLEAAKEASGAQDLPPLTTALSESRIHEAWAALSREAGDTTLATDANLRLFLDGKTFAKNPATGKKEAGLAELVERGKQQIREYRQALKPLKRFYPDAEADFATACTRWRRDVLYPAQDCLNVTEGFLSTLGEWRLAIENLGADAAYATSPLKTQMDLLNEAVSAENHRSANLEQRFEREIEGSRG